MILKVRDTSLTFSVVHMNYTVLENKFIFSSKFLILWIFYIHQKFSEFYSKNGLFDN